MIYLIAAICANLCMTFLMRYSEHHNGNCYALNIWNYLAGSLISLLLLQDKSLIWSGNAVTWGAGIVNGIGFLAALVLLQISIRRNGAPLTTTFNRLGILIPTILSIFLFDEIPTDHTDSRTPTLHLRHHLHEQRRQLRASGLQHRTDPGLLTGRHAGHHLQNIQPL